ncbi:MAG: FAD-dependent oxidoreductase, partial [Propionibacteriaceae bacterium]|nr:FAD-dependent oxidoreductase [Propionibacteriaceae bacterium]
LQDAGRVFETPDELIQATGLDHFLKSSLTDLARRHGVSDKLIDEFVTGVLRDMYNQTSDIVALAGLVGLAGAGLAGGSLVASTEGNATLFAQALDRIGADVRAGLAVTAIRSDDSGVTVTAGETDLAVDAVVLAAPLELAGIEITTADGPLPTATGRRYQDVHVTVVAGETDPAFFGGGPTPGDVLTTADPDIGFKAFAQIGHSRQLAQPIWKFFSAEELTDDFLGRCFRRVEAVHRHLWQAYPVLTPDPSFHPFRLARGVYQVNDFESAVSTLETEATIGWSVADLVARDLKRG